MIIAELDEIVGEGCHKWQLRIPKRTWLGPEIPLSMATAANARRGRAALSAPR
jgi:hypothetical protein